jgi:tRNA-2-methylthio-N6-dimethylallyladenosine synthase
MTYHIITIGCQMNQADSERLSFYLQSQGFKWTDNQFTANIVVLVTCGVRQSAEDRVYGLVNTIRSKNKLAKIVITGCLSTRADVKQRLAKQVDMWLELPDDYLKIKAKYSSKFLAYVPIGNGCNNFCSYCVVPYARGREVYRSAQAIILEVKKLIKDGYKEINLIAQNVNSYKSTFKNKPLDFPGLLEIINNLPGKFIIRFSSSHPKDMSQKLIEDLGKLDKVAEHLHLAVQSGDNAILKKMNRRYTASHYQKLIKLARTAVARHKELPLAVTTDVIVGYPGETAKQFANSLKLFKAVKFDMAYIAEYSPRYGTAAAKLPDNISRAEKTKRATAINEVLKKTALANNLWYQNKTVEVLVDDLWKSGIYIGQTRTAKKVKIFGAPRNIIGQFVMVKIKKVKDFGLEGKLVK